MRKSGKSVLMNQRDKRIASSTCLVVADSTVNGSHYFNLH